LKGGFRVESWRSQQDEKGKTREKREPLKRKVQKGITSPEPGKPGKKRQTKSSDRKREGTDQGVEDPKCVLKSKTDKEGRDQKDHRFRNQKLRGGGGERFEK